MKRAMPRTPKLQRVDGHTAKRRLSQSFLRDLDALDAIVAAGEVEQGDTVLEIGPGLGALTDVLLTRGFRVVAVELDDELIPRLKDRFAGELEDGSLTLIHGDALQIDLDSLVSPDAPWRVIANIPYHVTSPLLHRLLLAKHPATKIVLLVQLEVAERVAADVGDWSYLTAFVQARCRARILGRVSREAFEPVPAVDSAILVLDTRTGDDGFALSAEDEARLWRLVQAGFRERRKKLRNALPHALPISQARIVAALEQVGLDPDRRAQALGSRDWVQLLGALPEITPPEEALETRQYRTHAEPAPRSNYQRRHESDGGWIEVEAPGKINLTLAIVGRRADGYHDLHSVVARLADGDRLSLRINAEAAADELHIAGDVVAVDGENLVLRALRLLRAHLAVPPLDIVLEKRLPIAAGLGGGSSDAAAALHGALRLTRQQMPKAALYEIAAEIGSDVPLFFAGGLVLMEGRGERVTPLPDLRVPAPGVLIITPDLPLYTPEVFAAFAAGLRDPAWGAAQVSSRHLADELQSGMSAAQLLQRMSVLATANDLLAPARAVAPWLRPFGHELGRLLGRAPALSGSGPSLFLLYPSRGEADEAGAIVREALARGELLLPEGHLPRVMVTALIAEEAQ